MNNEEVYEYYEEPDTDTLLAQQKQEEEQQLNSSQEDEYQENIIEIVPPCVVMIKIDERNRIIAIDSDSFIQDKSEWIEIDRGYGDKYYHAQTQYLSTPLINLDGFY